MKQRIIASLLLVSLLVAPMSASAQVAVFDPSNYAANMLNHASHVQELLNQAREIAQQIQMVNNQIEQLKVARQQLAGLPQDLWNQGTQYMVKLGQLLNEEDQLAKSDQKLSQIFRDEYPQYTAPADFPLLYDRWDYNVHTQAQKVLDQVVRSQQKNKIISNGTTDAMKVIAAGQTAHNQMAVMAGAAQIAQMQVQALNNLSDLDQVRTSFEVQYYMKKAQEDQQTQHLSDAEQRWVNSGLHHVQSPAFLNQHPSGNPNNP